MGHTVKDEVLEYTGPNQTPLLVPYAPDMGELPTIIAVMENASKAETTLSDLFTALSSSPRDDLNAIILVAEDTPYSFCTTGPECAVVGQTARFNHLALSARSIEVLVIDQPEKNLREAAINFGFQFLSNVRLAHQPRPEGMRLS